LYRVHSLIAGGGRLKGIDMACIGAARVDNETTGVSADAEVGFAVAVISVIRDARGTRTPSQLDSLVHTNYYVSQYLDAAGAIRDGQLIPRREILNYFRNEIGGAHYDAAGSRHARTSARDLVAELERKVHADVRDGLHFEILSIGQAVARSPDFRQLAEVIRGGTSR
jgi:hypothetical protein